MIIQPNPVRDRKMQELRERDARQIERFLRANDRVVLMLTLFAIFSAPMGLLFLFAPSGESDTKLGVGCVVGGFVSGLLAWFQSRFYLSAITIKGLVSLTITTAISIRLHMAGQLPRPQNAQAIVGLVILFGIFMVWFAAVALPLRVALQAWTWHLQGIDLRNLQEEIRRRRTVPPGA